MQQQQQPQQGLCAYHHPPRDIMEQERMMMRQQQQQQQYPHLPRQPPGVQVLPGSKLLKRVKSYNFGAQGPRLEKLYEFFKIKTRLHDDRHRNTIVA